MDMILSKYIIALPEIFLLAMACVVLLLDIFLKDSCRFITYLVTQAVLLATALLLYSTNVDTGITTFNNMFIRDPMADVLKISILLITAVVLVYSQHYQRLRDMYRGEYYTLTLFAVLGMMIMISANSMLLLYLGLELLSLSLYAMIAFRRNDKRASEAAMKYFVLGAIASGMLLYGMSLIYGLTGGQLGLPEISSFLSDPDNLANNKEVFWFALVFIVVGLGFKFGAVPFHMWLPDVYQGAPTSVTLFLSSAPKLAAFALMMRLIVEGLGELHQGWIQMFMMLAILSIAVGNIVAIAQTNLKRMLAYSTISHMGFILLAMLTAKTEGYSAAMFYAIVYAIMSLGGFGIILLLSRKGFEAEELKDLKGLNSRHPWYAFIMLLILFSMAGIPPTVGFYAKLSVIQAVVGIDSFIWIAVFAVVMSVIGAYYYLRAIKIMYFDKPEKVTKEISTEFDFKLLITLNGLAIVFVGLFPGELMSICLDAITASGFTK